MGHPEDQSIIIEIPTFLRNTSYSSINRTKSHIHSLRGLKWYWSVFYQALEVEGNYCYKNIKIRILKLGVRTLQCLFYPSNRRMSRVNAYMSNYRCLFFIIYGSDKASNNPTMLGYHLYPPKIEYMNSLRKVRIKSQWVFYDWIKCETGRILSLGLANILCHSGFLWIRDQSHYSCTGILKPAR